MTSLESLDGWTIVFTTGHDYEAEMVLDRLVSQEMNAVIMSKKDHSFNASFGELGYVYVLVPPDQAEKANAILDTEFSGEELEKLAMDTPEEDNGDDKS